MKKQISPALAVALLAAFVLCIGGFFYLSQRGPSGGGAPAGRVVGGRHFPQLGGPAGAALRK
ncbi:MAG TPA: hypothetical protein VFB38_22505 [Chthonomonadaceae bacterium]|nr:hypothetical protein [Chthonomonadaceae bacterium]